MQPGGIAASPMEPLPGTPPSVLNGGRAAWWEDSECLGVSETES